MNKPESSATPESSRAQNARDQTDDGLQLTVHALPQAPLRSAGRFKMLLILLACAAPVVASYTMYFVVRPEGRTNYASLLTPAREWPSHVALSDGQGKPVSATSLRGQWLLVALAGASCDAACERRLFAQRQLREMLGRERERVDKLLIWLDDSPMPTALTQALAAAPAVTVLKAKRAELASWLGVAADDLDKTLYVVDPMGQWMMRAPDPVEPSKFKRDLERLLRASSSWDRAGR
jgi:hypothetical protein